MLAASAMPRAADSPTRSPVKLPGPVVTEMRPRRANAVPDADITRPISGISASAWPRFMICDSCAINLPASVSSTAAAQASSAVSMARINMETRRMTSDEQLIEGRKRPPFAVCRQNISLFAIPYSPFAPSHRPHFVHLGHEMPQQVLDAVLQGRGGRRTACAGTFHVEVDDAVREAA